MSSPRSILVVDDDARLRELLEEYLSGRGYAVRTAEDGMAALEVARRDTIDLIVLDVMMPNMDGFETLKALRRFTTTPVIMLTARGDEMDRIVGLEIGADDYMPKPFNPRELLARMQAVLRRSEGTAETSAQPIVAGPLVIDVDRRGATLDGKNIELTTTEFELLKTLVANAGRVIPRERLMELARGEDFAAFERSVDVHISHIRKKLGDDGKRPRFVKTVRGIGYTLPKDP